jgi:hypothetical protein
MVLDRLARTYRRNSDGIKLTASTVVMIVSGLVLGRVFTRAFRGFSPLERTVENVLVLIPFVDKVTVAAVLLGMYLGFVALLFFDYKKRVQSYLFGLGTVITLAFLVSENVLLSFMGPVDFVVLFVVAGVVIRRIGGEQFGDMSVSPSDVFNSRVLTNDSDEPVEFPGAAKRLSSLLIAVTVVALVEAHVQYGPLVQRSNGILAPNVAAFSTLGPTGTEQTIAINLLFSLVFIVSVRQFLTYEPSPNRIVFVGPKRSGKTHLIIGLYAEAQSSGLNPRHVSQYLSMKKDELMRTRRWVEATKADEARTRMPELNFTFTSEGLFPKDVIVSGLDYPGEYSHHIPDGLSFHEDGLQFADMSIDDLPDEQGDNFEFGKDKPIGVQLAEIEGELDETRPEWQPLIENARNEYEQRFKKAIQKRREERADQAVATDGGNRGIGGDDAADDDSPDHPDKVYFQLVTSVLPRVASADTACFLYDIEEHDKWKDGETGTDTDIEYYQKISDNADVQHIHAATKADRWRDEFEEEIDTDPDPWDDYDEFRDYVHDRLLGGPFADRLRGFGVVPLPVFIATEERNGKTQPRVPLKLCGFERILQKLGK